MRFGVSPQRFESALPANPSEPVLNASVSGADCMQHGATHDTSEPFVEGLDVFGLGVGTFIDAFDQWFTVEKAHWPNLTFTGPDGQLREFRKDRVFAIARVSFAMHANTSGAIQRMADAIIGFQFMFEPSSDVMNGARVMTSGIVHTFTQCFWEVKGGEYFCKTSMERCDVPDVPLPECRKSSLGACIADVSSVPITRCGDGDLDLVSSNKAVAGGGSFDYVESASWLDTAGLPCGGGESCGSAGCGGAGGPGGGLFNLMGWMQANAFAAAAAMFLMVHLVRMLPGILAMHMSTGALSAAQVRAMSVHISAEDAHV